MMLKPCASEAGACAAELDSALLLPVDHPYINFYLSWSAATVPSAVGVVGSNPNRSGIIGHALGGLIRRGDVDKRRGDKPARAGLTKRSRDFVASADESDALVPLTAVKFHYLFRSLGEVDATSPSSNATASAERMLPRERDSSVELLRRTEIRYDLVCPWCGMCSGSIDGLVQHLVCSHDRRVAVC